MGNVGNWIQGGLVGLLGLGALFVSSHSKETNLYEIGLILAAACTFYVFYLIKSAFDEAGH